MHLCPLFLLNDYLLFLLPSPISHAFCDIGEGPGVRFFPHILYFPPLSAVTGSMRAASRAGYSAASKVTIKAVMVRLTVSLRVR